MGKATICATHALPGATQLHLTRLKPVALNSLSALKNQCFAVNKNKGISSKDNYMKEALFTENYCQNKSNAFG
jgi:hypothetical protein